MNKSIFKSLNLVREKVSSLGLGDLGKRTEDSLGWCACTPYFSFGTSDVDNGMKNNVAIYLEGTERTEIQEIKIVLNINKNESRKDALDFFQAIVSQFFDVISVPYSNEIRDSILNFTTYVTENITVDITEKSDINTVKLLICNS